MFTSYYLYLATGGIAPPRKSNFDPFIPGAKVQEVRGDSDPTFKQYLSRRIRNKNDMLAKCKNGAEIELKLVISVYRLIK